MRIYFIEDAKATEKFFRKHKKCNEGRKIFLTWQGINFRIKKILDDNKIEFGDILEYTSEDKEKFIKEYTDIVDEIGKSCKESRLWWATGLASKNRFTSKLSENLQQFIEISETIKLEVLSELIVMGADDSVIASIRQATIDKDLDISYFGYGVRSYLLRRLFIIKKLVGLFFNAVKIYFRSVTCRLILRRNLSMIDNRRYILKTFIYKHSFLGDGSYKDVFFGKLLPYLENKEGVLILANILGNFRYCIKKIKSSKNNLIVPVEIFISFFDILEAVKDILFSKINVDTNLHFYGYDVSRILEKSTYPMFMHIQLFQYLHYASTKNMLRKTEARRFLITYENNPWEKMCVLAVREYEEKITILGYQHTVIPQASLNMFVGKQSKFLPDKILTVGEITKMILEKYGNYPFGTVDTACALRHEYLCGLKPRERKRKKKILLALEGVPEVNYMVSYVIDQLAGNEKYYVLIRAHPVLGWEYFEKKYKYRIRNIANFEISRVTSLIEDIAASDIVIYWGSTVAVEALSLGKPAIHFDRGLILSYDPLFEFNSLKRIASRNQSLNEILDGIYSMDDEQFIVEQNQARSYIDRYFYPVYEGSLSKFLYEK